jgi:D-threo-aldose 1-dehydrogenase
MLSKGPAVQQQYAYGMGDEGVRRAAEAMADACARFDVPLAAAALQFSLRAPFVDSTVVGVSSPERIAATLELAQVPIADELWDELERAVPSPDRWLDPVGGR